MSQVEVDKVIPQSGTTLTIGDSGDTINLVGTLQSNGSPLPGDISSVVAGTGLSGGGTTGAVTLNIEAAQPTITSLGTITGFTSTGIDDNADATAITIDSSERVGIGTTTMDGKLHVQSNSAGSVTAHTNGNLGVFEANGNNGISILTPDASTASIFFGSVSSNRFAEIKTAYDNNSLDIGTRKSGGLIRFATDSFSERVRITADGKMGIGTSSPAKRFHVYGPGSEIARFEATGGSSFIGIKDADDGTIAYIGVDAGKLKFETSGSGFSDKLVIDTAGNVGIGTTSPSTILDIRSASPVISTVDTGDSNAVAQIDGNAGWLQLKADNNNTLSGTNITFSVDGSEKARLDASGDLLIGKTSISTNAVGVALTKLGLGAFTRSGDVPIIANRTTSFGTILEFRKDNTAQGVIGSTGNFYIADNSGYGFSFDNGGAVIYPSNSSGTPQNNVVNLGHSLYRWKDIYLGGGAFLGGTGTANKLEDYEEGTFTPTFTNGAGFDSISYVIQRGVYTKIGRIINFRLQIELGSGVSKNSNRIEISGLPFTSSSALPGGGANWSYVSTKVVGSQTENIPTLWIQSSNSNINWYNTNGGSFVGSDISGSTTNMDIYINGTYQTDA